MGRWADAMIARLDALQAIHYPRWIDAHLASGGFVVVCRRCNKGGWPETIEGVEAIINDHKLTCRPGM